MCHITRLHFARAKPLIHSAGWQSSFFRRISVYIIVLPPTVVLKRFVLFFPGQRLQCHRTSAKHLAESVRSLVFCDTDF
ncbi:hypothetical protein AFLA_001977 [Aspergillus flavus NRRL3357]|nr:hypothetical protein AFLA_001977 [Aspergillus flavus NRRL3357]